MFQYFLNNELISPNQSGFKPRDSCVNQLIPTTHENCKVFNDVLELRGVFTVFDCDAESFTVANIFVFLSFSLQQLWTNWQNVFTFCSVSCCCKRV